MQKLIDERKNLKFTEVEKLSQLIPDPKSHYILNGEFYFTRYGMDFILKKYANIDYNKPIHAFLEHGISYTDYIGPAFENHGYLPSIVASKYRTKILKNAENYNGSYAIGPYIHYADSLLSDEEIKEEKERLGKNLVVFPSHSIEETTSIFDSKKFCDEIKKIGEDYDSIRIFMYYRDVNLNRYKLYQKEGFEVVTAGHFNDYNFLPRLKSIIKTSDMTMANNIGTQIGYCIYLNKPHYIYLDDVKHEYDLKNGPKRSIEGSKKAFNIEKTNDNVTKIKNLFSEYNPQITNEQKELISYLWGFDEVKTSEELKNLFIKINKDYSSLKYYLSTISKTEDIKEALKYYLPL